MKINNYGATGGASPIPYEYSYNSSQPHINCKHQTCPMNVPSVLPNVANRQHYTCLAPTLPKPHYPLLCTIALASLVKGRWIDGKAQTVALLHFTCDTSAFLFTKLFCRQDGGIAKLPHLACTNSPKTALSLALHHRTCLPCQR